MPKKSAVIQFIDEERAKGATDKQIRHKLLDAGWQMDIIQHAMDGKSAHPPALTPIMQRSKRTAPEVLVHPYFIAGCFIAMVLLAIFI